MTCILYIASLTNLSYNNIHHIKILYSCYDHICPYKMDVNFSIKSVLPQLLYLFRHFRLAEKPAATEVSYISVQVHNKRINCNVGNYTFSLTFSLLIMASFSGHTKLAAQTGKLHDLLPIITG